MEHGKYYALGNSQNDNFLNTVQDDIQRFRQSFTKQGNNTESVQIAQDIFNKFLKTESVFEVKLV